MLGQQMAGTSQEMMENFKKMMSVSGLPGGGQDAFATMQKAFGTAKDAFDQIAKASAAAFNMPGAGKGKSVKVVSLMRGGVRGAGGFSPSTFSTSPPRRRPTRAHRPSARPPASLPSSRTARGSSGSP
jgi:hypothetical protein